MASNSHVPTLGATVPPHTNLKPWNKLKLYIVVCSMAHELRVATCCACQGLLATKPFLRWLLDFGVVHIKWDWPVLRVLAILFNAVHGVQRLGRRPTRNNTVQQQHLRQQQCQQQQQQPQQQGYNIKRETTTERAPKNHKPTNNTQIASR